MNNLITVSRKTFFALVGSLFLAIALAVSLVGLVAAKDSVSGDTYGELKIYADALSLIQKNYVKPVEVKQLVEGSLKGMLQALDPHSSYLSPENYKELQVETKGEFGGLGIEITVKDGLLTVVSPIEDSPAALAGILPGDQIIKIGDEFTRELSLVDAVKKMRGPKGSPITISVHRQGKKELIPITIVRDIIKVKSVRYRELDGGFAYVRLVQFQEGTAAEYKAALKTLLEKSPEKKLKGLVLDLRNDPGGLLTEAIRVADLFLKDGLIVYTDGRLESQKHKYYAHDDGNEPDYPIIALVNRGSASASEIVAGALQDSGRALILGTQTFGKGSVQTILPMENGSALRLTTALYYTRNGRSIQAQGIVPDVVVPDRRFPKDTEELLEEDEQFGPSQERELPGALGNPLHREGSPPLPETSPSKQERSDEERERKGKKGSTPEPRFTIGSRAALEMPLDQLLREDPQLDQALKLLKMWHVFGRRPAIGADQKVSDGTPAPEHPAS